MEQSLPGGWFSDVCLCEIFSKPLIGWKYESYIVIEVDEHNECNLSPAAFVKLIHLSVLNDDICRSRKTTQTRLIAIVSKPIKKNLFKGIK